MNNMTPLAISNNQLIEKNYGDSVPSYINYDDILKSKIKILKQKIESISSEVSKKSFEGNDDFGHIIHKKNIETFYPSTLKELSEYVLMSQQTKIPLVCRGQGHSTFGQAQMASGLVIDLSKFNKVQEPQTDRITIECGAKWKDVLKVCLQSGLTPPVLTDYLGLSVGGVLSVGGISGHTHQHGTVADNVLELKVMTMDRKVHQCSRTENADLFNASLTTLGQFTIILEATIKLVPAPKTCHGHAMFYDDLQTYIEDQTYLVKNKLCDYVEGHIIKLDFDHPINESLSKVTNKEWVYMIEAVQYDKGTTDKPSHDQGNLRPIFTKENEVPYKDFANRMKPGVKFLKTQGSWHQQHPWINLFLPSDQVLNVVNDLMKTISPEDTGGWPILMYPINKSALSCEYFQTPESDIIWVLAMLRNSADQQTTDKLIEKNRLLYGEVKKNGGKMYPIGAIPMEYNDWKNHFGNQWKVFKQLKKEADPYYLLGMGQGIFKHKEKSI
ncbi:MAG TPA: FAD-binding protein [Parachlamydiaceae bacterium]|nr:FAD-binding protein [Parachlamydiaceae bacterium]